MEFLKQHIKPGVVYRRSDLEFYSSAVDRDLGRLVKDGVLFKLRQGLYYAQKNRNLAWFLLMTLIWWRNSLKMTLFFLYRQTRIILYDWD